MAEPHPVSERPITVLVAEDEDLLRRLVIRLLADEGYRTLEARDGAEALHLAHLSPHLALVVTDVVMPGMDVTRVALFDPNRTTSEDIPPTSLPGVWCKGPTIARYVYFDADFT